jgi:hypothetical protein
MKRALPVAYALFAACCIACATSGTAGGARAVPSPSTSSMRVDAPKSTGVTISALPETHAAIYLRTTSDGRRRAVSKIGKTTPHFYQQPPPGRYEVALVKDGMISEWVVFDVGSYADTLVVLVPLAARPVTKEVRDVLDGVVRIGMTAAQVRESWGDPTRKSRTITQHGKHETWLYDGASQMVTLEDDVVTALHSDDE